MPDDLPLVYWDACVFLSYVNGTPDRLQHIDALFEKSGKDFQIVTSMISIVEVAMAKSEQDGKPLGPETDAKINQLWLAEDSPVKLIEFHRMIAERARDLMRLARDKGLTGLKPMDAIHLATARVHGAKQFHSYDDLEKYVPDDYGFKVEIPQAAAPKLPLTGNIAESAPADPKPASANSPPVQDQPKS